MNLILLICWSLLEIAIASDKATTRAPPAAATVKQSTTPPETTFPIGTSPPLIHTTKSSRSLPEKHVSCSGWCLDAFKHKFRSVEPTTNATADDKLIKTFYMMKALVENLEAYPVRVEPNVFADKHEYLVKNNRKARSHIFNKNLLRIPTSLFFPYTRSAIKKALLESGNYYVPNLDHNANNVNRRLNLQDPAPIKFLLNLPVFTNQYFESNPILHNDMKYTPNRRSKKTKKKHMKHPYDAFNISDRKKHLLSFDYPDPEHNKRAGHITLKSSTLRDFINGNNKKRAQKHSEPHQINEMLGLFKKDTILQPSRNAVDDIIGGMKINGNHSSAFIIGGTNDARTKINKWVGPKGRSKKLPNEEGTGVFLKGKSKERAIRLLLKAMVQNFQFGDNSATYKKLNLP